MHLVPGVAEVFQDAAALKANCDAEAAACVAAQTAAVGDVISVAEHIEILLSAIRVCCI